MHLLARDLHGLDDAGAAVDLEQTPAEIVFLSFSDSELGLLARVHDEDAASRPSLRCASLAQLKHPFSVDLYLDKVARHARLVVVRLLGGKEYWSYGVEQLAALSRAQGFAFAIVPGDGHGRSASARRPRRWRRGIARAYGPSSRTAARRTCAPCSASPPASSARPRPGAKARALRAPAIASRRDGRPAPTRGARCWFSIARFFFRTITRQSSRSRTRSPREDVAVEAVFVASLKDEASEAFLREAIGAFKPDVIVNTTAFSARGATAACSISPTRRCCRRRWPLRRARPGRRRSAAPMAPISR